MAVVNVCRDGDPPPVVFSVSGANQLQATSSQSQLRDARKVSDERPDRYFHALMAGSSGLVADLCCSEPPKNSPAPTFADIVRKSKESGPNSKAKNRTGDSNATFDDRSFGAPNAFGQILEFDGRKIVSFSTQEIDELIIPLKYTLVGKFTHGFPSMKILRLIMGNLKLKGGYSVSLLEHKHVLIRLSCEEDYTRIWSRQVWFMAGFPMRVLKWTPNFDPSVEAPFAPIWVLFPYLPVHLFDQRSLFRIASVLGNPLRIDSATAELSRASTPRVCIEIDVSKALLPEVELNLGGKIRMQEVEYENLPSYCSFCKHLGHALEGCKYVNKASDLDKNLLPKTLNDVEVTVLAQEQPSCHVSPVTPDLLPTDESGKEDTFSMNSEGHIFFTPGRYNPTNKRASVSKIREDMSKSYERFDNVSEVDSDYASIQNVPSLPSQFIEKNYYTDGDHNSDSAPIVLPPKKNVKKKIEE